MKIKFYDITSLKTFHYFSNACIVYRIILTSQVIVASAQMSFLKLKLLNSYLLSKMQQNRLNSFALIAIENNFLKNFDCLKIIKDFTSKNARMMQYSKINMWMNDVVNIKY